ncbi:putative methyltransferase-like protein 7A [Eriocheir sinensis]|uniref:putative methyltransferase-like protein 7A n=1 Tax=Eriocheir sinensis TaxID=95602 RepID=UPI0021C9DA41|nr:putative methyltransferase-like protein 7A [Eriocheir sinensis]
MAQVDHMLASWIMGHLPHLILALIIIWVIKKKGKDIRHRWFAWFMNMISSGTDPKSEELKKSFFSSLSSVTSHDPKLRKENKIKILEVGVGTGVNFPYYPEGSHLIVVDPNPHFAQYYNENRKKFPNIQSEEILVTTGEEMTSVPDNSVDVVVMTLVLCSVVEVERILQQVRRVLAPGGKFYFMEHIREFDGNKHWLRRVIQDVLSRSGVWPFMFDGCNLNRDLQPPIEAAGFSKVDAEKFYAPITNFVFQVIKPHLKGVATK